MRRLSTHYVTQMMELIIGNIGTLFDGQHVLTEADSIIVRNDKIAEIGLHHDLIEGGLNSHDNIIDAKQGLVSPGLIDSHTHLVFGGSRERELAAKLEGKSYLEIQAMGGGINYSVRKTREASERELLTHVLQMLNELHASGVTTVEAKSGYGLETEAELRCLTALKKAGDQHPVNVIPTFMGAHLVPEEYKSQPDKYMEVLMDEMLPRVAKQGIAVYNDVFVDKGAFSKEQGRQILERGIELGLVPRLHADEFARVGASELAAEIGVVSADHLLLSTREQIKAMVEANVVLGLLPVVPYVLFSSEIPLVKDMLELGATLAISTDFNPNCWVTSMQLVISMATYRYKLTPEIALQAATHGGAKSLQMGTKKGRLLPGFDADITVFDVPNVASLPYRVAGSPVIATVIQGKCTS